MSSAPTFNGYTRLDAALRPEEIAVAEPYLARARQALAKGDAAAEKAGPLYQAPGEAGAELRRALAAWQRDASQARALVAPGARMRPDGARAQAEALERRAAALEVTIAPAQAAKEQARADAEARRARIVDLAAAVAGEVAPALIDARDRTRAARVEAEQRVEEARMKVEEAERTPPAGDVAKWARNLGALRDELAGYELLVEQARAAATAAEERAAIALGEAWAARESSARAQLQRAQEERQWRLAEAEAAYKAAKEAAAAIVVGAERALAEVQAARAL